MKCSNHSILSYLQVTVVVSLITMLSISCDDNSTGSDPPPESSEFNLQTVSTSSHGEVLADSAGNVLYFFTPDAEGTSTCEGECLNSWPVFTVDSLAADENVPADQVGTSTRSDGSQQTTFNGWPLYYYSEDTQPAEVRGDQIESFGGTWYVAKPNYSIMEATQQLVGHDEQNYVVNANGNYVTDEGMTTHFTDGEGRTLYIFINDSANTNNFTADDFSNNEVWPVYEAELQNIPSGMDESLFGRIEVGNTGQMTYKGWPLYYFGQDENQRGNTRGVSFPEVGLWPVAQADMTAAPGFTGGSNGDDGDGGNDDDRY